MKLLEMVIERRLKKETQVTRNQFGFIFDRLTMEVVYLATTICNGALSNGTIRLTLNFY